MPPGQRPFTPIDQSAKLDFAKKLMGRAKPRVFGGPNLAEQIGTGLRTAVNSVVTTPLDVADWGVQQLEKYVGGVKPKDHFDPASMGGTNLVGETYRGINQASNRVAGDIAAIPGVGKPSASPTASDIRKYGVLEGAGRAAVDYGNLAAMAYPAAKAALASRVAESAVAPVIANETIGSRLSIPTTVDSLGNPVIDTQAVFDDLASRGYTHQNYPADRGYVYEWTKPVEYTRLNNQLRFGAESFSPKRLAQFIRSLDRTMATTPPTANAMTVYRGIGPRNPEFLNQILASLETAKPGDILLNDPGYMATSLLKEPSTRYLRGNDGVIFQIDVPAGTRGVYPDAWLQSTDPVGNPYNLSFNEKEFLLPRNTQLQYVGRDGNTVYVKAIPGQLQHPVPPYKVGQEYVNPYALTLEELQRINAETLWAV